MDVAFIGLGNMGSAMAQNLIQAGHHLTVYNRTRTRAEPLQSLGARIAATPGDAARAAEILITMLADDNAVEEVLFAPGKVLEALRPGGVHISMGTISVALSDRLTDAHRDQQQHFIAAPSSADPMSPPRRSCSSWPPVRSTRSSAAGVSSTPWAKRHSRWARILRWPAWSSSPAISSSPR